jgi:hypothetical protein
MFPSGSFLTAKLRVWAFMLAAIAAGGDAYAEVGDEIDFDPVATNEAQQRIIDQLNALRSRDGALAESLVVPFAELAQVYEESREYALAVAALEQTAHLIRVNRGLHSLDQAPLLRQAIRNLEPHGDLERAWNREQDLVELALRHPEDLRTVPIFREVAERRMAVFDEWNAGEYPWQMVVGGYCGTFGQVMTCANTGAARSVLADAQTHYADAVRVLLRNELYDSDELRALEMELVRTSDLPRAQPKLAFETRRRTVAVWFPLRTLPRRPVSPVELKRDPVAREFGYDPITTELEQLSARSTEAQPDPFRGPHVQGNGMTYYRYGRLSLRRIYDYEAASAAPTENQLRAFTAVADWDLLYSRNAEAHDGYRQAHEWIEAHGAQTMMEELFAPAIPVVLPAFAPNPLVTEQSEDSAGYIDVTFSITRYGQPRSIRILETSTDAAEVATTCLVGLIRRSRFRPRLTDGQFLRTSPVAFRYYLSEPPSHDVGAGAAQCD